MKKGCLITVEGGEGSGKSTLIQSLMLALQNAGLCTISTREPGGTEGGEEIRKLLVDGQAHRWDAMSETAKDAYLHMMTSQLLQRKASTTRIMLYEELKLPVPSAQTKLFESLKQSQIKPKKCIPVLLMPPNLRPTYSLKK